VTINGFTIETKSPSPCSKCQEHIGDYYEKAEDLPELPFHYGCKCYYKANQEEIENNTYKELLSYKNILSKKILYAERLQIKLTYSSPLIDLIPLTRHTAKMYNVSKAIGSFIEEYLAMREANTKGSDKYFHAKANALAAQNGSAGYATAYVLSKGREIVQFAWEVITDFGNIEKHLLDTKEDMLANAIGREIGLKNKNATSEKINTLIRQKYKSPEDLIKDYKERQKLRKK